MCEFWDKWFPAFFLGSFERFSSINLKLILLILIFLGLVTQVFFLAFSLVLMAFVQVWFHQGECNFFFGPDLDLGIVISQIFTSWFVKLIDSVEISSCRDKIFIFFSYNVLNSPQSALFSFHLDLLDVPVALYLRWWFVVNTKTWIKSQKFNISPWNFTDFLFLLFSKVYNAK